MPLALTAAAGLAGAAALGAEPVAPVTVLTEKAPFEITAGGTNPVRKVELQQIVLENEYVRAVILPQLGGRIAQVYDKVAKADMFLKEYPPIVWNPAMRYSTANSQLGGIIVNFPYFHHGNSFEDNWNWQVNREADGTAVVVVGWTDKHLQQRVVQRITLRPGSSLLSSVCRYLNLNPYSTGFAPWVNTLFPYNDDLQFIIPSQFVVPHGFNVNNLDVWPWPWPDYDEKSICYWKYTGGYVSVFALQVERDFSGVYYHTLDRGTARLFDRREQPGVKLWYIPFEQNPPRLSPRSGFELWSGPALVHEDPVWWEGYAVRECRDAWMPVHGSGGFREANEHGAVNLTRGADYVEVGVCLSHRVPGAVVSLVGLDGTWWRQVADLAPDQPLRHRLPRAPGRIPLDLRVTDADGRLLINCDDRPDPGLRMTPRFTGKALSEAEGNGLLRSEQYHPLWRGPTGDKQPYSALAAGAYRAAFTANPKNVGARLGLARTLMVDAQLRSPDRPLMAPEQVPGFQKSRLTEAVAALEPALDNPEAAILAGEAQWRLGNAQAAADCYARGGDEPVAQLGLARALAELGKTKEAAVAAAAAAKGLPRVPPALQLVAGLAILRGQHAEAVAALDRLLAQDPLDALTYTLLAMAQQGAGKKNLAAAAERRAAELQAQTNEPIDLSAALQRLGLSALRGGGVQGR
jgi:hypothetical protein